MSLSDTFVRTLTLFLLLLLSTIVFIWPELGATQADGEHLKVTFLDVGQGDSIFIESPTGTQVLIDGGKDEAVLRGLTKELGYFDRDIDLVVATHPDADHIGGLVSVLERYRVSMILMTENENDTPVAELFLKRAAEEDAVVRYARAGQLYDLGYGSAGSTTLRILFPDRNPIDFESNTSSIVLQLGYGDVEFMLTGDAPQAIEEYLVHEHGDALESEVLKAGHHGSRTSSAPVFVERVKPAYAVISAGKDNTYGHPHKEVTELFTRLNVPTKNTADLGSIVFESDGVKLTVK